MWWGAYRSEDIRRRVARVKESKGVGRRKSDWMVTCGEEIRAR